MKSAEIVKMDKVGEEEVYVVSIAPKNASKFAVYVSSEDIFTFEENPPSIIVSSTSSRRIPITEECSQITEMLTGL